MGSSPADPRTAEDRATDGPPTKWATCPGEGRKMRDKGALGHSFAHKP
jgi:hypothetical protein